MKNKGENLLRKIVLLHNFEITNPILSVKFNFLKMTNFSFLELVIYSSFMIDTYHVFLEIMHHKFYILSIFPVKTLDVKILIRKWLFGHWLVVS